MAVPRTGARRGQVPAAPGRESEEGFTQLVENSSAQREAGGLGEPKAGPGAATLPRADSGSPGEGEKRALFWGQD